MMGPYSSTYGWRAADTFGVVGYISCYGYELSRVGYHLVVIHSDVQASQHQSMVPSLHDHRAVDIFRLSEHRVTVPPNNDVDPIGVLRETHIAIVADVGDGDYQFGLRVQL